MRGEQILTLMRQYEQRHVTFIDRLYTSVPLIIEATRMGQDLVGTYDGQRGVPAEIKITAKKPTQACPRGFTNVAHKDGVTLHAIMDNGRIYVADNVYGGTREIVARKVKGGHGELQNYELPKALIEFGKFLGGTDAFDHMSANRKGFACVAFNLRTKKWTLRLGFDAMLDLIHCNAWCKRRCIRPDVYAMHSPELYITAVGLLNCDDWLADWKRRKNLSSTVAAAVRRTSMTPREQVAPAAARATPRAVDSPSNHMHKSVSMEARLEHGKGAKQGRLVQVACGWCLFNDKKAETCKVTRGCKECGEYLHQGECHMFYHRYLRENGSKPEIHRRERKRKDRE
jgi:hypothetical protein